MQREELKTVLEKIRSGNYTAEEEAIAKLWLHQLHQKEKTEYTEIRLNGISEDMWSNILAGHVAPVPKTSKLWPRIAVAASIMMVIGLGIWFYKTFSYPDNQALYPATKVLAGTNKATLILANGKTISLSDSKTGIIIDAKQLAYDDGTLIQTEGSSGRFSGTEEIKIATPRGGTYQVQLPDGTKVWLNAASSLSYGTILRSGRKVRKVKLNGEAYFEVAKVTVQDRGASGNMQEGRSRMPFIVESNNQQVEVLGTHFNINSYTDEPGIKTTLLEGSVLVRALPPALIANPLDEKWKNAVKVETVLKPGEQAILRSLANLTKAKVDVEQVVAWKNGVFVFRDESLESMMRKISRWYNVDVSYAKDAPMDATFGGYVSRSRNLFTILERMEKTGKVKFTISGRQIMVLNNSEENE
jgi:transmembrane sensor